MPLTLRRRDAGTLPIDASWLRPDRLSAVDPAGVARIRVRVGDGEVDAADLFEIGGDPADGEVRVEGDLRSLRRLGAGMASGRLRAVGEVGNHAFAGMAGGEAIVEGSAGDYLGAEMAGGSIRVSGSAGDLVGAAYPGSRLGMREGLIAVDGAVGADAGLTIRRGLIVVGGPAGPGLGRDMIAGSIFAFGPVGRRVGAGMRRGTIALFDVPPTLLPTFRRAGRTRPPFVSIYLRWLADRGLAVPPSAFGRSFDRYNGDLVESGKGEILIASD